MSERISETPPSADPPALQRRRKWLERAASIGTSAQAAIPGVYAWSITVAPAAWSAGASWGVKLAASVGVIALLTAPLVEREASVAPGERKGKASASTAPRDVRPTWLARVKVRRGPEAARAWSVWGFVLSSAVVWLLAPSALSPARLDVLRGGLGMVGWALFAFASAGPVLRAQPQEVTRLPTRTSLKPRSELSRGDGAYILIGVVIALVMQVVGWGITVPERAVLVRLVTVVCGMAVLGATTSIALARHTTGTGRSTAAGLRRALPWLVMLVLFAGAAVLVKMAQ